MRRRWAITAPDSQEVVLVLGSSVYCENQPRLRTHRYGALEGEGKG